jgi:hypothetical protein
MVYAIYTALFPYGEEYEDTSVTFGIPVTWHVNQSQWMMDAPIVFFQNTETVLYVSCIVP